MSSNIDPNLNRTSFFPKSKSDTPSRTSQASKAFVPPRNTPERMENLKSTNSDVKVDINEATRDFARIKAAVDMAPEIDNSKRIADLKNRIESGQYQIDYDALADEMLKREF